MITEYLIKSCPNGCGKEMNLTEMVLAEGALRECPDCKQLVSSCTRDHYEKSNKDWNTEEGTWPSEKDFARLLKRRKKDIDWILKLLGSKNPNDVRILDVGSSNGSFVFIANSLGLNAEGVDISEKAVLDAIKRGLKIHHGFLNEIGFEDNSFDAITLHEVIEHVSDPSHLLKECNRILKPNGVLLVGTGNIDSWTRAFRKNNWDFFNMQHHGGHISFFSPYSLSVLANRNGFEVVKVITHAVKFYEKNELSPINYRIVKTLAELLNWPSRLFHKGHQMEVYLKAVKSR